MGNQGPWEIPGTSTDDYRDTSRFTQWTGNSGCIAGSRRPLHWLTGVPKTLSKGTSGLWEPPPLSSTHLVSVLTVSPASTQWPLVFKFLRRVRRLSPVILFRVPSPRPSPVLPLSLSLDLSLHLQYFLSPHFLNVSQRLLSCLTPVFLTPTPLPGFLSVSVYRHFPDPVRRPNRTLPSDPFHRGRAGRQEGHPTWTETIVEDNLTLSWPRRTPFPWETSKGPETYPRPSVAPGLYVPLLLLLSIITDSKVTYQTGTWLLECR